MNSLSIIKNVPANKIAVIFKDYFEQHMLVYDLLKGIEFVSIMDVSFDKASIIYHISLNDEDKQKLMERINNNSIPLIIYNRSFTPKVFLNGDLLCLTLQK